MDIRTHSIVSVIDHLLTQELEWDNESPSGGEKNDFMKNLDIDPAGWGWWGGKGDEKNKPKQRIRRPVPKAEPQMDCMVGWNLTPMYNYLRSNFRIALIGNMVIGRNRYCLCRLFLCLDLHVWLLLDS